ncbi:hypothetical protein, partial [Bacillus sp. CECT 9360]|uniref:hypothetical protein n=1 Tax=Bacillus sp. CECT 9360 TaxID=2845821 RepID=UPI001E373AD1
DVLASTLSQDVTNLVDVPFAFKVCAHLKLTLALCFVQFSKSNFVVVSLRSDFTNISSHHQEVNIFLK